MELRHLRYFVAVAEERNFGRAARRLYMSQPPLSMQIKALENELGVTLFDRGPHRTQVTPAGAAMLQGAYEVLNLVDLLPARVAAAASGETRTLSVGAVTTALNGILPGVIRGLQQRHEGVRWQLREMNTGAQLDDLESGKLSIGLVRRGLESTRLAHITVLEERLMLAVSSTHPTLGNSGRVSLRELADQDFIFFSREIGRWHYDEMIRACEAAGFTPRVAEQCDTMINQLGMVSAGLGVALVTELTQSVQIQGVRYIPLDDASFTFPLIATWDEGIEDPLRTEFINMLKDAAAEFVDR